MFKKTKSQTPGTRHRVNIDNGMKLSTLRPIKKLRRILKYSAGRNAYGRITVRHRGGRQKRYIRNIDFKRDKREIEARAVAIEYDPNRSTNIALVIYQDGEKRYILAPDGLKIGDKIKSSEKAEFKVGNALPLKKIPVGMPIHNLEIMPGKGGQIVRGAGVAALIQSKEGDMATVKLPSGEIRRFPLDCFATIGQLSNVHKKNIKLGKAGRRRLMGWRPAVRGVAMHPDAHPHGGGEGRSGIGMPSPKTPWGKKTLGKKTRKKNKYSNQLIIKRKK